VANSLRFLNDPSSVVIAGAPGLSGWFHGNGAEWFSLVVKRDDGSVVDARIERRSSPDIAAHFRDPLATSQRYNIAVECNERCRLELQPEKGEKTEIGFAQLANAPVAVEVGTATFYVDTAAFGSETSSPTPASLGALRLRALVLTAYRYVLIPLAVIGAIAFSASTILYWNRILWNVCYVVAAASWLLVLSRVAVLLLIDITSFPALSFAYMAPAQYMLVCAAVFSCAAWRQLASTQPAALTPD
jgi:hypothetical protein